MKQVPGGELVENIQRICQKHYGENAAPGKQYQAPDQDPDNVVSMLIELSRVSRERGLTQEQIVSLGRMLGTMTTIPGAAGFLRAQIEYEIFPTVAIEKATTNSKHRIVVAQPYRLTIENNYPNLQRVKIIYNTGNGQWGDFMLSAEDCLARQYEQIHGKRVTTIITSFEGHGNSFSINEFIKILHECSDTELQIVRNTMQHIIGEKETHKLFELILPQVPVK